MGVYEWIVLLVWFGTVCFELEKPQACLSACLSCLPARLLICLLACSHSIACGPASCQYRLSSRLTLFLTYLTLFSMAITDSVVQPYVVTFTSTDCCYYIIIAVASRRPTCLHFKLLKSIPFHLHSIYIQSTPDNNTTPPSSSPVLLASLKSASSTVQKITPSRLDTV